MDYGLVRLKRIVPGTQLLAALQEMGIEPLRIKINDSGIGTQTSGGRFLKAGTKTTFQFRAL